MKKSFGKILISFIWMFSIFWFVSSQSTIDSLSEMELFKYYWVTPLILNIHKEIWMWRTDDGIIYSYSSLLQNIKNYVDIDVLLYLKKTIYPESSLNSFLSKSEMLLNTANAFMVHLDNLKTDLAQKKSNCDSVKEISDKNFALALKDFDSISMDKYLTSSLENEQCSVWRPNKNKTWQPWN